MEEPVPMKALPANVHRRLLKDVENSLSCAFAQKCQSVLCVEVIHPRHLLSAVMECPCCRRINIECTSPSEWNLVKEVVDLRSLGSC
eukprot:1074281-Amphidinium_carterae.1